MRAMGGKGDTSDQKIRATQDQLRLARITQDVNPVDDDRANVQKLIKKVVETTRCTVSQAEIALFDNDNNVEEAVNAILEDSYADTNVWKEQKSRRAKRLEAEERAEESAAHRSNRSHPNRSANNFSGAGRGRGSERGRGGFRGGTRGAHGGRGGYQSAPPTGGPSSASNVWDNSQASKTDASKEWISPATNPVEEIPEDTDWKTAGTLVFSRRDDVTQAAAPVLTSSASGTSSVTTSSVTAPISFAAVAAAGASKAKEVPGSGGVASTAAKVPTQVSGSSSVSSANSVTAIPSQSTANSIGQSQLDNISSLYQNAGIVSTSSQLSTGSGVASEETPTSVGGGEQEESISISPPVSISCVLSATAAPSASVNAATSVNTVSNASADWTAQLKNDLGIGSKGSVSVTARPTAIAKSPPTQSKPLSVSRPLASMITAQHPTHTVEFVSGDLNGSSALPEYQFGFHVDPVATSEERNEDVFTSAKPRSLNSHPKVESDICADTSSVLSGSTVNDFTSSISQQPKGVTSTGGVNMTAVAPVPGHSTAGGLSRHSASSGLSYADISNMSYPSSENRSSNVKPSLSLHQQQQAQHQLYTATQIPYNSYPYLNMYSPVTGVRQDEAQYAAALVQYPFGMGQIDMSSLSTMLPPAALASQQQPSQPPPPVQNQHQQRPDQHGNYVDLSKAYAAAAVANSTAGGGSGSGLLGNQQQQRDSSSVSSSAVAPPPGFSGPPSNMPTATFTLPQHNHLSSLFQMPPTYHPQLNQLNQLPFSFMLPNVTGNGQHKLGHQMFAQQTVEESLSDQRMSSQQQKVYGGGHQQMDKYGTTSGGKDRLGGGAQATPPPQMYQAQAAQGYLSQPMPMHAHTKKTFNGPQHWSAS